MQLTLTRSDLKVGLMSNNPWVTQAASPTLEDSAPPEPESLLVTVTGPQSGVLAPAVGLPIREYQRSHPLWWLGVHGGAGESTLAALTQWPAAEHAWPTAPFGSPSQVVLVARGNRQGLRSARIAMQQWASGTVGSTVTVLGLLVIPDAPGRFPRELRADLKVLGGGVPHLWTLPWVEAWRTQEPTNENTPPTFSRTIQAIISLATSQLTFGN